MFTEPVGPTALKCPLQTNVVCSGHFSAFLRLAALPRFPVRMVAPEVIGLEEHLAELGSRGVGVRAEVRAVLLIAGLARPAAGVAAHQAIARRRLDEGVGPVAVRYIGERRGG